MLKPTSATLTWPRLIGLASGTFGAASTLATGTQLAMAHSFGVLNGSRQFITAICGCVFLFLAFPLYAGREWARRGLLLATYVSLVGFAILISVIVFRHTSAHLGPRVVIGVGGLVAFVTPPAFILAALHHGDVRRAFQIGRASCRERV